MWLRIKNIRSEFIQSIRYHFYCLKLLQFKNETKQTQKPIHCSYKETNYKICHFPFNFKTVRTATGYRLATGQQVYTNGKIIGRHSQYRIGLNKLYEKCGNKNKNIERRSRFAARRLHGSMVRGVRRSPLVTEVLWYRDAEVTFKFCENKYSNDNRVWNPERFQALTDMLLLLQCCILTTKQLTRGIFKGHQN